MKKIFLNTALALSLVAGTAVATSADAEARGRHHHGRGAGAAIAGAVIGLGVLGAYAATRDRCYEGRRVCDVVGTRCWRNSYGERVCKEDVRCHRPTICD
jgi:hypothetical protein